MSRLKKKLTGYNVNPNYYQPNQNSRNQREEEEQDYNNYYEEDSYDDEYQNSQYYQPALVQEYNRLQQEAAEYDKEMQTMEAMNPHAIYKDVVTNPTPKGVYKLRLFGRPVDLAKLEHYLIHKVSPKTVTTLMRYNDSRTIEEVKGYSKRPTFKLKGGLIWIILGAIGMLGIGILFFSGGGSLTDIFGGMFGM